MQNGHNKFEVLVIYLGIFILTSFLYSTMQRKILNFILYLEIKLE